MTRSQNGICCWTSVLVRRKGCGRNAHGVEFAKRVKGDGWSSGQGGEDRQGEVGMGVLGAV